MIGVNPATDTVDDYIRMVSLLDELRSPLSIPTQTCCLGHVTMALNAIAANASVDVVFQSIAGSQLIPPEAETVEQAVMGHQTFGVWCNSDGRIQPQPISDGLFEHLLEKGQLKETPLDELVTETLEEGRNVPNEEIIDMFETLHEGLVRATSTVADEIARRRR